jgi:hypothetical protein
VVVIDRRYLRDVLSVSDHRVDNRLGDVKNRQSRVDVVKRAARYLFATFLFR